MILFNKSSLTRLIVLIFIFVIGTGLICAGEKTPFTAGDSLRIKSFSPQSMTENGRFIAGTISIRLDRLGADHKRYRDPTYISPRLTEVIILDTKTAKTHALFKTKVHVRSMTFSPDGKTLAFFLRKGDFFYLHIYDMEKKKIRELKLKAEKKIASNSFLIWRHDGTGIFLALRADGWEEKSRTLFKEATEGPIIVYDSREPFLKWDVLRDRTSLLIPALVDIKTRKVRELFPEERYSQIRLAKNDSFITYIVTYPIKTEYGKNYYRQGGREYTLFRLDLPGSSEPKILIERGKKRLSLSWNEENTMFAWADEGDIFVQSVDETKSRNLTKDKVKPEKKKSTAKKDKDIKDSDEKAKEEKVRFSMMRWSPDDSNLLASTKKGYWLIDHKSGDVEMVYEFPEKDEKESQRGDPVRRSVTAWSPDGRYLYMTYSATDKWERGFTRYDLQERRMEDLVKDSNLYRSLRMSKDGQKFFYTFSNGDLPGDMYTIDKDFNGARRLTDLNPWVLERKLTRSELVKYLDVDGNELYGILYYPVDYEPGKKYPLVCEIYERFFNNGFNSNMNIITNQGWFGLRPSVDLNIGYPGEAWVKGVTSVINKLIEQGLVDSKKLAVHGTSYGGYATSLLITQTDRFAAAVNISGKVNIISFLGDSPRIGHRNYGAAEAGQDRIGQTVWEAPLKYINHSAVMFADRIKTPHLLITGEGDWNVPAGNTRELYYALRRLGKECVWVNYWNDGHGLGAAADKATYLDKWNRIIDWYKTHFVKADEKDKKEEKNN
ncbi:MAG: prolyl oligopeptidase family serine peptidase [Candidatus Aminicenantes bacterium]|nr:prolyl oligopeptidase family serine peptidase [Candidatus Aminicenantes bacterium]